MRPGSIVRWKSFWLGVLVLVFLVWGWVSTRTEQALLYCIADERAYAIGSGSGYLHVAVRHYPGPGIPFVWHLDRTTLPEEERSYFAAGFENGWVWDGPKGAEGYIAVGYWLLLVGFLVLWGGFLMWRWRRVRKGVE